MPLGAKGNPSRAHVMVCTTVHNINNPMIAMLVRAIHIKSCTLKFSSEGAFEVR